jgi:hypothetical protein
VRQADWANHNPPAASSAAMARDRCFLFILFLSLIPAAQSLSRRHGARISGSWLSIWNEGGDFWCEPPASRNEPHLKYFRIDETVPGPALIKMDLAVQAKVEKNLTRDPRWWSGVVPTHRYPNMLIDRRLRQ